ncbi:MAG: hypothetical protein Tsb002_13720 [Wenzhouxiangellaceae bacterium]
MYFTEFEKKVLETLISGDSEEDIIREQLEKATVCGRNYTGVGLFTAISVPDECVRLTKSNRYIEETPKAHLEHPDLVGGQAPCYGSKMASYLP